MSLIRLARTLSATAAALLVTSFATASHAGANDPGPISYDTKLHLGQEVKKGVDAVTRMLSWVVRDMAPGAGDADWLAVAAGFDERAQMIEMVPSFQQRGEWTFGATPVELRAIGQAIRDYMAQNPKPSEPDKQELFWVELGTLEQGKHTAFYQTIRDRVSAAAREGEGVNSWGSTIAYDAGDTFAFEVHSPNRAFTQRAVGIVRDVEREMGAHWE